MAEDKRVVMSTGRGFPGHYKPGNYETRTECSRAFPRDSGDHYPVKNAKENGER